MKIFFLTATNNKKPSRPKTMKISLVSNMKLRGFQEVFIRTLKQNSELFKYGRVQQVFFFLKIVLSVV